MESLALLVTFILLAIYGSGLIAFVLSCFKNRVTRVLSFVFSGLSILSGLWIGLSLINGNGVWVGGVPIVLGALSIWNAIRVSKRTN